LAMPWLALELALELVLELATSEALWAGEHNTFPNNAAP